MLGSISARLFGAFSLLGAPPVVVVPAHQVWVDGTPVPEWVRNACCGPADVHHLLPAQVHRAAGGYRVDGVGQLIPLAKTLPSEDGDYWIFYRDFDDGTQYVFCFFAPPEGS